MPNATTGVNTVLRSRVLAPGDELLTLFERFAIEVPVIAWPASPRRLLCVSCQIYNTREQYQRRAAALGQLLPS